MTLAGWESLSFNFLSLGAGVVIRSLVLAAVCAVLAWVFRSHSAALRHLIWKGLLYSLLLMPVLLVVVPPFERASGALTAVEVSLLPTAPVAQVTTGVPMPGQLRSGKAIQFRWPIAAAIAWLTVSLALLLRLGAGIIYLQRLGSRSETIRDKRLGELAHSAWLLSRCPAHPRIGVSRDLTAPVTFGVTQPQILLPEHWNEWDQFTLTTVLTHEFAHITRNDALTAFLAAFASCVFWFHPLAWFLRRRLASLAEEACDEEVVVTYDAPPEAYARVLIDFARTVRTQKGRLSSLASAMAHTSGLQSRIERLFVSGKAQRRGRRLFSVSLIALFVPVIYLAAASRFDEPAQSSSAAVAIDNAHYWELANTLTAEDQANLSANLQAHPDDLDTRSKLLVYYQRHNETDLLMPQLLWFIGHHPDSALLQPVQMMLTGLRPNDSSSDILTRAWKEAVAANPHSAIVLLNAAQFFTRLDPKLALHLFSRVQALDPSKGELCRDAIDRIYAAAEIERVISTPFILGVYVSPDLATELDTQLESSNDPALLSRVGSLVITSTFNFHDRAYLLQRGSELIQKAIALDPANPAWKEALVSAEAEPARQRNIDRLEASGSHVIRIGAGVADANLIKQVAPVYPPSALAACQQGEVEFTITIGKDGHVHDLELVRGNAVFVQAALQSILARVYRPTLLNGEPVDVVTEGTVSFRLPQ